MEPLKKKLTSRKFLSVVVITVLAVANDLLGLGIDDESLIAIATTGAAFILGESALDRERIKAEQTAAVNSLKAQAEAAVEYLQGELVKAHEVIESLTDDNS